MTRREEIASLYDRLADTFARLAVLYHDAPPSGGKIPPPPSGGHDEPAAVRDDGRPRNGPELLAWARGNKLLPRVEALGKSRKYPRLILDWMPDQVADIYQAVTSKAKPGSYRQAVR